MTSLSDAFDGAMADLGNLSQIWNPFSIIDMKGMDGHEVFSAILPRIMATGAGILALMVLLRAGLILTRSLSSGEGEGGDKTQGIFGAGVEVVLTAALLASYPDWVRILPTLFTSLGNSLMQASVSDLTSEVSGALAQIGNEKSSDFLFWSAQALSLSVVSLLASLLSTIALILLWVMAKLQGYLFAFWYLLGPLFLPTLVFPPLSHIGRSFLSTLLGVSLMGVTGPLLYVILVRSGWLSHAFAAGGMLDAISCLVFSLLTILLMVSIPILSMKVFGGVESRVFAGAALGGEGVSRLGAGVHSASANFKASVSAIKDHSKKGEQK